MRPAARSTHDGSPAVQAHAAAGCQIDLHRGLSAGRAQAGRQRQCVLCAGARSSVHCAGSPAALAQAGSGGCYFSSGCRPVPAAKAAADGSLGWVWDWAAETAGLTPKELAAALPHVNGA